MVSGPNEVPTVSIFQSIEGKSDRLASVTFGDEFRAARLISILCSSVLRVWNRQLSKFSRFIFVMFEYIKATFNGFIHKIFDRGDILSSRRLIAGTFDCG